MHSPVRMTRQENPNRKCKLVSLIKQRKKDSYPQHALNLEKLKCTYNKYLTNPPTLNNSQNISGNSTHYNSIYHADKSESYMPVAIQSSISKHNSIDIKPKDMAARSMGNSKFKIILSALEPTAPFMLQPLNIKNGNNQNPVLKRICQLYQPRQSMKRRIGKGTIISKQRVYSVKENRAPNIMLAAINTLKL